MRRKDRHQRRGRGPKHHWTRYEEQVREQRSQLEKEDISDMVAEHAAKQKNKWKEQSQDTGRQTKKYEEFKF